MIMTTTLEGEKCCLKPHNVSSSPSLTMAARYSAFKISFFKSLSSLELSLFFPKTCGLHTSGSIETASITLKTSFFTF
jgi:hypothetical protein